MFPINNAQHICIWHNQISQKLIKMFTYFIPFYWCEATCCICSNTELTILFCMHKFTDAWLVWDALIGLWCSHWKGESNVIPPTQRAPPILLSRLLGIDGCGIIGMETHNLPALVETIIYCAIQGPLMTAIHIPFL